MRRPAVRLRVAFLLFAALALWLAPLALERNLAIVAPSTAAPRPASKAAKSPPSVSVAVATPPPAPVYLLEETPGSPRSYVVALDQLYLPSRPASRRTVDIASQPDLDSLLAYASSLAAKTPEAAAPRLVLYPVGAPRNAITRRIVNPRIDVLLESASAPSPAIRRDLGIVGWERPAYAPDHAIARIAGDAAQPLRAAALAATLPGVRYSRPLLARKHFPRFVPNDPLFKDQWHLRNTGQQGGVAGVDIRAVPAWDTTKGAGIVIGVVDDGVDLSHPDLSPALDNSLGYDWNGNDTNPSAEGGPNAEGDDHGTAVSGLAAARGDNRVGVAGVAPSATLAALRLIAAETDDSEDASAMTWLNDRIQVKNNSWGPSDSTPDVFPAGPLWLAAVTDGATNGRNGRGTLYFWAAGNGQSDGDQGTLDGYGSARPVIAVAATNNKGAPAYFSEGGPHVVVAAPGDASAGLVTTDRAGDFGYNTTKFGYPGEYAGNIDYTRTFNGTSAAAPVASGVGALLLAARPDLGWRDVKEILLRSSAKLRPTDVDWISRAAGDATHPIKQHPRLGGGNIDALAALTMARDWTPLGAERELTAYPADISPVPIPDNSTAGASVAFEIFDGTPVLRVEHAVVTVNITHPYRADLEITLTSPSGTVSRFTQGKSKVAGADFVDYPFNSVRHWGEPSHFPSALSRRWTLKVRDAAAGDTGVINSATLTLYGTELTAPKKLADLPAQSLATGSTLVLRASFSGGNLDYEWLRDGKTIAGANTAEFRLANFSAKSAGTYACVAKNSLGSASVAATVSLSDSPRATFAVRAGATTSIDLHEYVAGDVKLWKTTALPAGLSLNSSTGLLTGRPTKPADKPAAVTITATAADGTVIKLPLAFTISPLAPSVVGGYVALVARDSALNAGLGGSLSLTVSASGAASGSLMLGTTAYPFSGLLDGTAATTATLDVTLAKPALRLALRITETEGVATLSGTLTSTSVSLSQSSAAVSGARAAWATPAKPATAYVGAGVAAFLPATETDLPLGATVVTFTVAANGRATWLLTPADGSPALTGSTPLTDQGVLLAYAAYASTLGSFEAEIPAPTADSPALSSDARLDWLRKPAPAFAVPGGFGPLDLAPVAGGGRYAKPAAGVRILGLTADASAAQASTAASAALIDSVVGIDAAITVGAKNTFAIAAPNPTKLALAFAADTGRVTGTEVVASPARTARITAVVLPFAEFPVAIGSLVLPAATNTPAQSAIFLLAPAGK